MKSDLDQMLRDRGLDALWVTGSAMNNPAMSYFTGLVHVTVGDLIVRPGQLPELFHYPMEREEAARTGLPCRSYSEFDLDEISRQAGGCHAKAAAARMRRVFAELGVHGKIAVMGKLEIGSILALVDELRSGVVDFEIVVEPEPAVVPSARMTKDPHEIDRIRAVGKVTTEIVAATREFLESHYLQKDILVRKDGTPLTVGDVKAWIRQKLSATACEAPEGFIFAAGRDSAIPHSTGESSAVLRTGQTIVFDFFPQERGGGYFYDFTRTWCLESASEEVQSIHAQVWKAHEEAIAMLHPGTESMDVQLRVCKYFESQGHPSLMSSPHTEIGYVHGLGHGLGLDIHEPPYFSSLVINNRPLQKGMVFTIEPGLYYPERGIGVRLEDTLWLRPDGKPEILAPFPMDLVLKPRILRKAGGGKTRVPVRKTAKKAAR